MAALAPEASQTTNLDRLAKFLTNIGEAWRAASAEQKNKLARTLFQEIWIKDNQVAAVKPQPELEPFFELNYEEFVNKVMKKRPRWGSGSHVILSDDTFPVEAPIAIRTTHKLHQDLWPEVIEQSKIKTYRQLADEYEVSYESIRRVLNAALSKKS